MISQVFWPDTVAVAQHLGDFAEKLSERNHDVTVWTSLNAYEDPTIKFPVNQTHKGIKIERIRHTSFGKSSIGGRLSDFASFNALLYLKMLGIKEKQYDLIFSTTSPPLVAFLAVKVATRKKIPFCYWTMDLQPELAIVSGMLKKDSFAARQLSYMGTSVIRRSNLIFTLDHFMRDYLTDRGGLKEKVHVHALWPVMSNLYSGSRLENPFRLQNGFEGKTVIMYSGNHAFVHPLDTLLDAALKLQSHKEIVFVFIGGGIRKKDVTSFSQAHPEVNIIQLPYQPRENIHISLASADLQVVVLGDGQVGYTHPNKVYGAMFIGKPILYIGPRPSHITDILDNLQGNIVANHGESESVTDQILRFIELSQEERDAIGNQNRQYALQHFEPEVLKNRMADQLEDAFDSKP